MDGRTLLLAIDQGTTSTRAIVFSDTGQIVAQASRPVEQIYPRPGWVEHDATAIWYDTLATCHNALEAVDQSRVAAIGITNQRETVVLWDRDSGEPIGNAIVWQDRRTAAACAELIAEGLEPEVTRATGLVIDPYFSATKLAWALDNIDGLRARAEAGRVCFGTVDSWLIFKLTGGALHVTDATNASRTMLYDIHNGCWHEELLKRFDVPAAMLPQVWDCQADFGTTAPGLLSRQIPIRGAAGDQQSASYGQACFAPGMVKATYGTGCFVLANTGSAQATSANKLLRTVANQRAGAASYCLEGSIFMAGATVQWLRDELAILQHVGESERLAREADEDAEVYVVPAFQGLGAPYWDAGARGAILGLTRGAGRAEITRAALDSVAFQTRDLLQALVSDLTAAGIAVLGSLRVDGGMTANAWLMQRLADLIGLPVEVAAVSETTALGAAFHAGLAVGVFGSEDALSRLWSARAVYQPRLDAAARDALYAGWQAAVARVRSER